MKRTIVILTLLVALTGIASAENNTYVNETSPFEFSGWDESNTVMVLIALGTLTIAAFYNWPWIGFACLLTAILAVGNEHGFVDADTWSWEASIFFYMVAVVVEWAFSWFSGINQDKRKDGYK
jgi:lysylphosphatidylglycerol synthetase-like protein (DUF2156 family)